MGDSRPRPERGQRNALLQEWERLSPEKDVPRMRQLLTEAAALVDQAVEPQRWAGLRAGWAWLSEEADPASALTAYAQALPLLDPVEQHDSWLDCHEGLGRLLAVQQPQTPELRQQAIDHLERVVQARPVNAGLLATLHAANSLGDPWQNWRRRVDCQQLYVQQIDRQTEPWRWTRVRKELAIARQEEPDLDFGLATQRRLQAHAETLAQLPEHAHAARAEISLALSECHGVHAAGGQPEEAHAAQELARQAWASAEQAGERGLQIEALLRLAQALGADPTTDSSVLAQQDALYDQAAALIDPAVHTWLQANMEKGRALLCLQRIERGNLEWGERLAAHAEAAVQLMPAADERNFRRVVLQIAGEGLLRTGDYQRACDALQRALTEARAGMQAATTRAGRMARIWELRDSAALLAHGLLRMGRTQDALLELDQGKTRFWQAAPATWTPDELAQLVPERGALLIANFATDPGAVTVLTTSQEQTVWLPALGRTRLQELLGGSNALRELGGWLGAYYNKLTQPQAWQQTITDYGRILHAELWSPLLECLSSLGVGSGSELLWVHQGGSQLLPIHAAWHEDGDARRRWLDEDYTLRHAPSISALRAARPQVRNDHAQPLLVADTRGDLPYSQLECAWTQEYLGHKARQLTGSAAQPEPILQALARASVVHLSAHARFDVQDPLRSCVLLAGDSELPIEALLHAIADEPAALVVLSACETAVTRVTSTPDEALGFPAALLHAGVRSVLASLWPVDDVATAFLVTRFHREMHEAAKKPAHALRSAQRWLRQATAGELIALLADARKLPGRAGALAAQQRNMLRTMSRDARPYAAPLYWAAFTVSGVE